MKNRFEISGLVLLLSVLFCMTSCEVEFDPNEDWKSVTVIYGVLDQDSDTTFLRIQKGFLGSGNYIEFAKERDSIYYKPEEIDVFMVSYYPWDKETICDTFFFDYNESYSKPEGDFYSEVAPIYCCRTAGRLSYEEALKREYKVIVRNKSSLEETWATTCLIGDYDITSPGSIMYFVPKNGKNIMTCSWYNLNSRAEANHLGEVAKFYQHIMRFYYKADGQETYTDIEFGTKINTSTHSGFEFTFNMDMADLVNGIKKNLAEKKGHCSWTGRVNAFELYVQSCNLEMYEYYINSLQTGNILSDEPIYTNVQNGYGLFAARRRHIKHTFTQNDEKLLTAIGALNYGF